MQPVPGVVVVMVCVVVLIVVVEDVELVDDLAATVVLEKCQVPSKLQPSSTHAVSL